MCLSKPKVQKKVEAPAPTPAPQPTPEAPVLNETATTQKGDSNLMKSTRQGVNALRIALNIPQSSGNGLNIPR